MFVEDHATDTSPATTAANFSAGTAASFCARADSFLSMPRSARVGASDLGGSDLVPPNVGRPVPALPFAFGIAASTSPNFRSACNLMERARWIGAGRSQRQ